MGYFIILSFQLNHRHSLWCKKDTQRSQTKHPVLRQLFNDELGTIMQPSATCQPIVINRSVIKRPLLKRY